jgi:hypothetical protein
MGSKQSMSTRPAKFNSSIGPVPVWTEVGDGFCVQTAGDGRPLISLEISPDDNGKWEVDRSPLYYTKDGKEAVAPADLVKGKCCNFENGDRGGPERNWAARFQAARSNSWSMN